MLMEDSTTYQLILGKGEEKGLVRGRSEGVREGQCVLLLEMGTERFGPPSETTTTTLRNITDQARFTRFGKRLLVVSSWEELLAGE